MKYTTVEGHEIKEEGFYETRGGRKVFIYRLTSGAKGLFVGKDEVFAVWNRYGRYDYSERDSKHDIMRPWRKEKTPIPKRKIYKLSEIWKIWLLSTSGERTLYSWTFLTKAEALDCAKKQLDDNLDIPLAITLADATEFYEGEGL